MVVISTQREKSLSNEFNKYPKQGAMKQRTKFLAISLLLAVFVFTGFGCKGPDVTAITASRAVTLEYWTVFDDVDAINALIAGYRADRPYITVNVRQLRADELYQRLIEALADDTGPDVISVSSRSFKQFASKLAPMPASVSDTKVQVIKGQISTETVVTPSVVAMPTLTQIDREYVKTVRKDVVLDGQIYGLPLSMDTMALYYNKDLLDRASVPEPPKDWVQFQEAVKKSTRFNKLTGKISQAGVAMGTGNNIPGADDLMYILFKQSGLNFVDDSGRAVFGNYSGDNNPAASVVTFYTDFANASRDTYSWNEEMPNALDNFINGSSVFFFGYSYNDPIIKARAPQLNYDILPMLQLDNENPVNVANYWIQSVVSKSKHQNEAWGLINYLAYSKANQAYLDATGRPTALRAYIPAQKAKLELAPFVSQVLVSDNWYRGRNYDSTRKAISDMCHDWLQPPPRENQKIAQWQQEIMNIAASKINQTL